MLIFILKYFNSFQTFHLSTVLQGPADKMGQELVPLFCNLGVEMGGSLSVRFLARNLALSWVMLRTVFSLGTSPRDLEVEKTLIYCKIGDY